MHKIEELTICDMDISHRFNSRQETCRRCVPTEGKWQNLCQIGDFSKKSVGSTCTSNECLHYQHINSVWQWSFVSSQWMCELSE